MRFSSCPSKPIREKTVSKNIYPGGKILKCCLCYNAVLQDNVGLNGGKNSWR